LAAVRNALARGGGHDLSRGGVLLHLLSFRWLRAPAWKDKAEARKELARLLAEHAHLTYDAWAERIGQMSRLAFTTDAGTWYQATIEPVWDDQSRGTIRILVALDDGGVGAYHPLTESWLLKTPGQGGGVKGTASNKALKLTGQGFAGSLAA
jgi:hypothetical protein